MNTLWSLNPGDTFKFLGSFKVLKEFQPMQTTQELADTVADGDRNWHKAVFTDGTEMSVLPQEWALRLGAGL